MMTLDEAISHCIEVANGMTAQGECEECAADHRQLAEWLNELKTYRDFARWVASEVMQEDFDGNLFSEIACRRLNKLGIVGRTDTHWIYDEEEVEE